MGINSIPSIDPDYGDRITYGEVVLEQDLVGTILAASDWRQFEPLTRKPRKAASPKLYRKSRPGSLDVERRRAREVVNLAKAAVIDTFNAVRFGNRIDVERLTPIIDAITASIQRDPNAIPSVTRLKARSEYTYLHSVAVCGLMIGLARELRLDPALTHQIGLAGLLHDIGKAVIPQPIIDKPGPLTDEEFSTVKLHPQRGHELLSDCIDIPDLVRDVVLHHHERMDGRGYPDRLLPSAQSVYVRMAAICDVYDAVTSVRAYKDSWSPGAAIEWMRSARGHFDPHILAAFVKMLGAFPPGTLVRLDSDRLAVVLDDPDCDPLNPPVVVFHCAMVNRPLPRQRVLSSFDQILCVERPDAWRFRNWEALREELMAEPTEAEAAAAVAAEQRSSHRPTPLSPQTALPRPA